MSKTKANEALECVKASLGDMTMPWENTVNIATAMAGMEALLEIGEQLRVANLIALANAKHLAENYDDCDEAVREAAYSLIEYKQIGVDTEFPILATNIAEILGIKTHHFNAAGHYAQENTDD